MKIMPWVAPIEEEARSIDEESSEWGVDDEDLNDLGRLINCDFVMAKNARSDRDGDSTPSTEVDSIEDEDVIDPCLLFLSEQTGENTEADDETTPMAKIATSTSEVKIPGTAPAEQVTTTLLTTETGCDDIDKFYALPSTMIAEHDSNRHHSSNIEPNSRDPSEVDDLSTSKEGELATNEIHLTHPHDSAPEHDTFNTSSPTILVIPPPPCPSSQSLCPTDPPVTLQTSHLTPPPPTNRPSRTFITKTFLRRVNQQCAERGQPVLPACYTTHAMLRSGIVPWTVLLEVKDGEKMSLGEVLEGWEKEKKGSLGQKGMCGESVLGKMRVGLGKGSV